MSLEVQAVTGVPAAVTQQLCRPRSSKGDINRSIGKGQSQKTQQLDYGEAAPLCSWVVISWAKGDIWAQEMR